MDSGTLSDRMSGTARLARSAGLVSLATMTSRLLGLVRDQVLAARFGSGDQMDAFNVAFRLPNLLRDLFAEGAMSAAFVPTFTRFLQREGRDAAWRLANLVITTLVAGTALVALAGVIFARPLTELFAGAYASVPGKLELTVLLSRIMFPFLTLVALAVAFMGMLNAMGTFFIPALSPVMFNIASIASVFLIVPLMPAFGLHPIVGLAIGVLLGGLGQVVLQWPAVRAEGYRYTPVLALGDRGLREVLSLMGPGTIGMAAVQINLLVNTMLAAGEGTGAVSWLNFAFRIMYLPIGLFGVSIATVALPALSRHAAQNDTASLRETVSSALRMMLMLNVPATFGLIALSSSSVRLILERGEFTSSDTVAVAGALAFYAPGLVGYSAVRFASPAFYALQDSRTPVAVSMATVALNVALSLTLVGWLGYRGLALATALAALFNGTLLLWLLRRRLNGLDERRLVTAFVKILLASLGMAIVARLVDQAVGAAWPVSELSAKLARVSAGIAAGLVTLALLARLLRIQEFEVALQKVKARVLPSR